jgi:hypothetical protein
VCGGEGGAKKCMPWPSLTTFPSHTNPLLIPSTPPLALCDLYSFPKHPLSSFFHSVSVAPCAHARILPSPFSTLQNIRSRTHGDPSLVERGSVEESISLLRRLCRTLQTTCWSHSLTHSHTDVDLWMWVQIHQTELFNWVRPWEGATAAGEGGKRWPTHGLLWGLQNSLFTKKMVQSHPSSRGRMRPSSPHGGERRGGHTTSQRHPTVLRARAVAMWVNTGFQCR